VNTCGASQYHPAWVNPTMVDAKNETRRCSSVRG